MKTGEAEARTILTNVLNLQFDMAHSDEGIGQRKPDLLTTDGVYIEVTHTHHSHSRYTSRHPRKPVRLYTYCDRVQHAIHRHYRQSYERDKQGKMTEHGRQLYVQDVQLLQAVFGSGGKDDDTCHKSSCVYGVYNILREIRDDKGKKYKDFSSPLGLFVFITEDEMKLLLEELRADIKKFEGYIPWDVFDTVYLCQWNFSSLEYEVQKPVLIEMKKTLTRFYNC